MTWSGPARARTSPPRDAPAAEAASGEPSSLLVVTSAPGKALGFRNLAVLEVVPRKATRRTSPPAEPSVSRSSRKAPSSRCACGWGSRPDEDLRHRMILHAYVTEKSMDEMERQNKLEFVVDHRATRAEVKAAVEGLYQCNVAKITTKIVRPVRSRPCASRRSSRRRTSQAGPGVLNGKRIISRRRGAGSAPIPLAEPPGLRRSPPAPTIVGEGRVLRTSAWGAPPPSGSVGSRAAPSSGARRPAGSTCDCSFQGGEGRPRFRPPSREHPGRGRSSPTSRSSRSMAGDWSAPPAGALVTAHDGKEVTVQLPSGDFKVFLVYLPRPGRRGRRQRVVWNGRSSRPGRGTGAPARSPGPTSRSAGSP